MKRSVVAFMGLALIGALGLARESRVAPAAPTFSVVESTIRQMQAALKDGRITSRGLVEQYLQRLALYEHRLHAAIAVNPEALALIW